MGLTKKQKLVFDYICQYIEENDGVSPTQKEIQAHFGFKSLGSVQDYIRYLVNSGYLRHGQGAVRGLEPVSMSEANQIELPLLGKVAAGLPIEALEATDTIVVPSEIVGKGEHYALQVEGNSMIDDGILDGDIVVIRKEQQASNGETVVALLDGEATIKRYQNKGGHVELHPANPEFAPIMVYGGSFEIRGVLAGLLRQY